MKAIIQIISCCLVVREEILLLDDFQYMLSAFGEDVYINQNETATRIMVTNTNQNDVRKITGIEELNAGDEVNYKDSNWLIVTIANKRYDKYLGLMRKCNLNPFYFKVGQDTYNVNGLYEKNIYINPNNEPINLPNDEMMLTIPKTEFTDQIKKSDKFYIFEDNWYEAYTVEGIDRSRIGLLIIKGKETQVSETPEEYYNLAPQSPTIGSVIVTPSTLALTLGETYQFSFIVRDLEENTLPDETVTWSSSNTSVATVDQNGLATSQAVGECNIIATSNTDTNIKGNCSLSVVDDGGWW